jgi:hypothetical protein
MAKFLVQMPSEVFEAETAKDAAVMAIRKLLSGHNTYVYPVTGKLEWVTMSPGDVVTLKQTVEVPK